MTLIGFLLLLVGVFGLVAGSMAFGDIGIACIIGGLAALLSGIGFLMAAKKIKKLS